MKKAVLKQLQKLAQDLPILQNYKKVATTYKMGKDLIAGGVLKTEKGEDIVETQMYPYIHYEPISVNHYENLKKVVRREGAKGIKSYTETVMKVVKQIEEQYMEELRVKQALASIPPELNKALEQELNKTLTGTANSEEVVADKP